MNASTRPRKDRRTKRERFLPYAFARSALSCRITAARVDDRVAADAIDEERYSIALEEASWDRAEIEGAIVVDASALDAVFPPEERAAPPGELVLAVRCDATRLRGSERVGTAPLEGGVHPFRITIRRADVVGAVELVPALCRSRAGATLGFATEAGSRLATGRPWTVRVDAAPEPSGKFLETRYRRFSEDEGLRPLAHCLYHLELTELPKLWINSDHAKITPVLDDQGTRGPRARTREVVFDLIAQSVWTQLFVHVATDLGASDELVYDWEHAVLRELLPELCTERSHEARLARFRAELARGELPSLLSRLDAALQRRSALAEHVTKLIEDAVERRA